MTAKEVLKFAKENKTRMVDFKSLDFVGIWQHFTVPMGQLSEEIFDEGLGFDGSSIRGWQPIHASDMLVIPDPTTAVMDPFMEVPTLSLICNIIDPLTKEPYSRDPRNIAIKAEAYLKSTGVGDVAYFGPEPEFFIFDDVRYGGASNNGFFYRDSGGERRNRRAAREIWPGWEARPNEAGFPAAPPDTQQ